MKIVCMIAGMAATVLTAMFLLAGVAMAKAGKCMEAAEKMSKK